MSRQTPETLSGAQIVVRLLERQGIRTLAGIPGGAILPIYDALSQSTRIHHVLARPEQGGGFMAQGMARATGVPAVCLASSGPGATNLLTAIADAKLDSIPLVAITGQVPRAMIGTDAFQEVDTYGLSIPITKHNFLVGAAEDLLEVVPRGRFFDFAHDLFPLLMLYGVPLFGQPIVDDEYVIDIGTVAGYERANTRLAAHPVAAPSVTPAYVDLYRGATLQPPLG